MNRRFAQVDVFTDQPLMGNPVAVVIDGDGLTDVEMQAFASWMNLSETTFLAPPLSPLADYRVRIFTPTLELPFAGHPTLGACHAWLEAGGVPRAEDVIVQECGLGLVRIRRTPTGLAFAGPARRRSGPPAPAALIAAATELGIPQTAIVEAEWLDNGVPWLGIVLGSVDEVRALEPGVVSADYAAIAATPPGADAMFEVRAFFPKNNVTAEDPVTGSLAAALADWLVGAGRVATPFTVSQGAALGRFGRVHVDVDAQSGGIWVAGGTVTCIRGLLDLSPAGERR